MEAGVNGKGYAKTAAIGAAAGAMTGVPAIVDGIKGMRQCSLITKQLLENNLKSKEAADEFARITKDGVVSFSEKSARQISKLMKSFKGKEKLAGNLFEQGDKLHDTIMRLSKDEIKLGLKTSLLFASVVGAGALLIKYAKDMSNKNKQVKEQGTQNIQNILSK